MVKYRYKLTDEYLKTYNRTDWSGTDWKTAPGNNGLCSCGWLHCYTSPLLAVLLNPTHADFRNPRLLLVEVRGLCKTDNGLKEGWTEMRRVKEMPVPVFSAVQRTCFGILCALHVFRDEKFVKWANEWLCGKDRTTKAAQNAVAYWTSTSSFAKSREYAAVYAANAAEFLADSRLWATVDHAVASAAVRAAEAAANAANAAATVRPLNLSRLAKRAYVSNVCL